jgi:hypothetical protein
LIQIAPGHAPGLPHRIDQRVNLLARVFDFWRWYAPQRMRPVFGLVMASNKVVAGVALPEREVGKVCPVRVNLFAIGQARGHIGTAGAAVKGHGFSLYIAR